MRFALPAAIAIAIAIAADVSAQNYPAKPIRIIIPTAPGGNPDFIAGPIVQEMSESLKQPIVIAEAGFPDITASAWFGLFAPVNTPRDIVMKLHAEAVKALAIIEIRENLERAGIEPIGNTPEEFGAQVKSDIAKFTRIAREAGIRAD